MERSSLAVEETDGEWAKLAWDKYVWPVLFHLKWIVNPAEKPWKVIKLYSFKRSFATE